jgi:4-diphosphocytidyl-2-C-methyl-D-erythritol kinase
MIEVPAPAKINLVLEVLNKRSDGYHGGSSDAAITLMALNKLWNLHIKQEELLHLAAQLGSDVPFFFRRGMALVKGRGERVIPLPTTPIPWFVVLSPTISEIPAKTKKLYAQLKEQHFTQGQYTSEIMQSWSIDYHIDPRKLFNVFDSVAFEIFPELERYWSMFKDAGADNIHLAGSGPSLFAPFDDQMKAGDVHRRLEAGGLRSYVVSAIAP